LRSNNRCKHKTKMILLLFSRSLWSDLLLVLKKTKDHVKWFI